VVQFCVDLYTRLHTSAAAAAAADDDDGRGGGGGDGFLLSTLCQLYLDIASDGKIMMMIIIIITLSGSRMIGNNSRCSFVFIAFNSWKLYTQQCKKQ